jgi:hypothetical protein
MFDGMTEMEVLKLFAPLLILQTGLTVYCIINILTKGVRSLNKKIWLLIVLIPNTVTAIAYLLLGKKRWDDD